MEIKPHLIVETEGIKHVLVFLFTPVTFPGRNIFVVNQSYNAILGLGSTDYPIRFDVILFTAQCLHRLHRRNENTHLSNHFR